ncbi:MULTISPECIES: permease [Priestia]|uniref:Permease protein, putative n=2 Tax=Priestia megaterium TaxID=1404 RepID=Q849A0_PRIM1|nr:MULTISPECIES: permease [Priestia]AAO52766.1 permease protein, putative [Priestia megaterium QM B1551]MBG9929940.1 membrane protein [Priestia aryabhattai]MBM6602053.1 permease [Priestia megaterium]MBV6738663.1 permease [Priestia megaterium]MBW0934077.1 permease [Priestia megaterium]
MSSSLLQMNTIFISILIEALPFILLGVIISGIIQIFVTDEMMAKAIPKNKFGAIVLASVIGALFPACECGIVPITRRLMAKGVPLYAAIPFMLTGPIINPVVLFATFVAFGNDWKIMIERGVVAFLVSLIVGLILAFQFKTPQVKNEIHVHTASKKMSEKIGDALKHTIDEFFSVGKFVIIGGLIAAAMQTYVKTSTLITLGHGVVSSNVVMMGLSYILSLCSSADAFIASSFRSTFNDSAIIAFLVFGPMFDIKNTLMMLSQFKTKFVFSLFVYVFILVLLLSLLIVH